MNLIPNKAPGGISAQERRILNSFLTKGKQTICASDLTEGFHITRAAAHLILSRLSRKGWLQRLQPGVYGFVPLESDSPTPVPENSLALAMDLFAPCYFSGWTAAEHWDLTEQVFNAIQVCSSRTFRTKIQEAGGIKFQIHRIPKAQIFGTTKIWSNNIPILIADPHRTVIDILNTPALGAGGRHALEIVRAYWQSGKADPELLLAYAARLDNGTIYKRLGFTAEKFGTVTPEWLEKCKSRLTKGVSKFDPAGPNKGPILTRWQLRINVPTEDNT